MENKVSKDWFLPAAIIVAGIMVSASILYANGLGTTQNIKNVAVEGSGAEATTTDPVMLAISEKEAVLGNKDAKVVIIEFGDYQCPFCVKFGKETFPQIKKEYVDTGKAKIVYRDLAFLGPESKDTAMASLCAREQGKFWEYHEKLINVEYKEVEQAFAGKIKTNEHNGNLNRDLFKRLAGEVGANVDSFLSCYDSKKYESELTEHYASAQTVLGERVSTPSFTINGKVIQGAQPFANFKTAIDEALAK